MGYNITIGNSTGYSNPQSLYHRQLSAVKKGSVKDEGKSKKKTRSWS